MKDEGYNKALAEANLRAIQQLADELRLQRQDLKDLDKSLSDQIQSLKDELNMYKTVIKVVKAIGLTVAFVIAFKFGDIASLWRN